MNVSIDIEDERKKTKKYAKMATIIYLILFPFLFMFAATSIMIFDSPSMTVFFGLSIIFLCFCVPLSIPFTFYFVWSQYFQGKYKKSRQFCLLPLYIAMIAFAYHALVDTFLH
jgi:hypothetical protein